MSVKFISKQNVQFTELLNWAMEQNLVNDAVDGQIVVTRNGQSVHVEVTPSGHLLATPTGGNDPLEIVHFLEEQFKVELVG